MAIRRRAALFGGILDADGAAGTAVIACATGDRLGEEAPVGSGVDRTHRRRRPANSTGPLTVRAELRIVAPHYRAAMEVSVSLLALFPRIPRGAGKLVALTTVIGLVIAIGAPAADARPVAKRDCASDLAEARASLAQALELRAAARKGKYFLLPSPAPGRFYPIHVASYVEMLTLQLLAGEISRADLKKAIKLISERRAATVKALNALVRDLVQERDEIKLKCAQGTAKPPTAPDGAFPGGTATTMTLTIEGHAGRLDLKTGKTTYTGNTSDLPGTRRISVSGSVQLDGTLPAGWNIYVHAEAKTAHTGKGAFTITDPIGSQRRVGATAQICASPPAPNQPCETGNGKAGITVYWTWVP